MLFAGKHIQISYRSCRSAPHSNKCVITKQFRFPNLNILDLFPGFEIYILGRVVSRIVNSSGPTVAVPVFVVWFAMPVLPSREVPMKRRALLLLTLLLALFQLTSFLNGQAVSGSLTGVITDSSGAAVRGASVDVVSQDTGVHYQTKTNEAG